MPRQKHIVLAAPPADPFGERRRPGQRSRFQLLGGQFHFETDHPQLLRIVQSAYSGLPSHRFSGAAPRCRVRVILTAPDPGGHRKGEPPRVMPVSGGGILCGVPATASFVALSPRQRSALLVISRDMLGFPYHVRYEMLEFAVYVLASRVQGLVPLHAACVGHAGQGILLLGESGSGKSTVSLHCLLAGFDFLAEDSVLVHPRGGLLATGIANFLHARRDSLRFLDPAGRAALLGKAVTIRRRSGVEKLEIDLRRAPYRLAPAPLRLTAVVFVSSRLTGNGALLVPMPKARLVQNLAASQLYAASQPGWSAFTRQVHRLPAFELTRGRHPRQAVEKLKELLPFGSPVAANRRSKP